MPIIGQLDTEGQDIIGVAPLGGRIYVVCVASNIILAFETSSPYRRVDGFPVPGMDGPGDLGASDATQSLYVVNWAPDGTSLWRITPANRTGVRLANADNWTGTLSMMTGDLVLGVTGTGRLVAIDGRNGSVAWNATLPASVVAPQHAVAADASGNSIYVCHGWRVGQQHRICLLNRRNSTIVRCYGNFSGNATGQLNWPRHIALVMPPPPPSPAGGINVTAGVNESAATLYAVDYFNYRVLAFDAQFLIPSTHPGGGVVMTGNVNGTRFPQRLSYLSAITASGNSTTSMNNSTVSSTPPTNNNATTANQLLVGMGVKPIASL